MDRDTRILHKDDLKVLLEEAAAAGARKALREIGLGDDEAAKDISAARSLGAAWREAKTIAWQHTVKWFLTIVFAAAILGATVKLKLFGGN